jgi:hypothetical protein
MLHVFKVIKRLYYKGRFITEKILKNKLQVGKPV